VPPGPDDLFIAADPHQRIYDNRVSLASLGIQVRGRSRRLTMNYRTTQEILAWAVPLLGPDPASGLDGAADSLLGYRSPMHGQRPQIRQAGTREQELTALAQRIRAWLDTGIEPHAIGVAARATQLAREARDAIKAAGIPTASLAAQGTKQAVRTGTMHGMKGLEFQAVAVIGVEQGLVPATAAVTPPAKTRSPMPRTCGGSVTSCSWHAPGQGTIYMCPLQVSRASSCRSDLTMRNRAWHATAQPSLIL